MWRVNAFRPLGKEEQRMGGMGHVAQKRWRRLGAGRNARAAQRGMQVTVISGSGWAKRRGVQGTVCGAQQMLGETLPQRAAGNGGVGVRVIEHTAVSVQCSKGRGEMKCRKGVAIKGLQSTAH